MSIRVETPATFALEAATFLPRIQNSYVRIALQKQSDMGHILKSTRQLFEQIRFSPDRSEVSAETVRCQDDACAADPRAREGYYHPLEAYSRDKASVFRLRLTDYTESSFDQRVGWMNKLLETLRSSPVSNAREIIRLETRNSVCEVHGL